VLRSEYLLSIYWLRGFLSTTCEPCLYGREDLAKPKLIILILMTFLAVSCVALPESSQASSSNDNWTMFHHDLTHTGYSIVTPTATSAALLWNYTTNNVIWASPTIVDGHVYIPSDDGNVYCLDAVTGNKIWNTTIAGRRGTLGSSVAFSDGYLYFGGYDRNVYYEV